MADAPDNHVTDDEGVERISDDPELEVFVGDEPDEPPGDGPPGRNA